MSTNDEMVRLFEDHPPDDLRVFTFPTSNILRLDDEVLVIEEVIGDDIVLGHDAFFDRWFTVTTTDRLGRLVEAPATDGMPAFAVNIGLSTLIGRDGDATSTFDLWLDVLVRPAGLACAVVVEHNFESMADDAPAPARPMLPVDSHCSGATLATRLSVTMVDAHARQC